MSMSFQKSILRNSLCLRGVTYRMLQDCPARVSHKGVSHKGVSHKGVSHKGVSHKGVSHKGVSHKGVLHCPTRAA